MLAAVAVRRRVRVEMRFEGDNAVGGDAGSPADERADAPASVIAAESARCEGAAEPLPPSEGTAKNEPKAVSAKKDFSAAGTSMDGGYGGRYASDKSPQRSREVVHPRTWPGRAKIAETDQAKRSPPKTAFSGRGTSPPKPTPGVGEERVRSPQAGMRKISSSTGVRLLDPMLSWSVAGSGKRDRKSSFPLALPLRHSRMQSNAMRNSSHRWTRALWSPTLSMLSSAM